MSNGDTEVNPKEMDDEYWENILKNFSNTATITDFQALKNIADQVTCIPQEKCALDYGMTEDNGFIDRSNTPNSGNKITDDSQRLYIFQQTVENYRQIWDKLDNREKNFVYTCVCGRYVDTLGLFFLNRLQRNNMVESQDKCFKNLLIDIETNDLTNLPESDFPERDYSQYQNEDFGLPRAYSGNLDSNQIDEFPTPENFTKKQFEECKKIYNEVTKQINKVTNQINKDKQDTLDGYYQEAIKQKDNKNYNALIELEQNMRDLLYRN